MPNIGPEEKPLSFELLFTVRHGNELVSYDKIDSYDIVSLCAQFQLLLAQTTKRMVEIAKEGSATYDDIPF